MRPRGGTGKEKPAQGVTPNVKPPGENAPCF
nr:MAG TPA: hypothetical protein [Bacteriophage sp.]